MHPYGSQYQRRRERVIGEPCVWCGQPADTGEHVPPLSSMPEGKWEGDILPACKKCNFAHRCEKAMQKPPKPAEGRRRLW